MPKHPRLMKRGNVFYHRAAVPNDIRDTYGKTEETFSLGTRDPQEALRRVRLEGSRVDALFQAHRAEIARQNGPILDELTEDQVKTLADVYYAQILAEDESERLKGFSNEDFDLYSSDIAEVEAAAREAYARGTVPGFVQALFAEITKTLSVNWRLRDGSASWPLLSREFLAAAIKASAAKKQRQVGDVVETPTVDVRSLKGTTRTKQTITGLFEAWERDHEGSAKTVADNRRHINSFIQYLGHDEAERVSPLNVSDFCDHLRHERKLIAKTVNAKYLATIRAVYRVGISKALISSDPTAAIKVRVPKKVVERPKGFTDSEAKAILLAALEDPAKLGRMAPHNKLAIRWVPWICAYTGARAGEITQLRKEDFQREHGIDFIVITPEAGSVKSGQYRKAPLHPHLIEMGLLELVNAHNGGPLFYVPNTRKRSNGHKTSDSTRGKVGDWVRDVVGIKDKRVQPNHAWRHRFKTVARNVDIGERYMDAIQGHDDGSASVDYGDYSMTALYREIVKMPRYATEAGQAND
ncbi:MAG: integrase [Rhizobiaceae bacterium]|nr:integrase [Rhizobiaceae bacterium]